LRVLSIDGGGIRGLLPATLVAEIEARAGKPAHELFDLMVGTSIGGTTVLGLTAPEREDRRKARYSASEIVAFFAEAAPRIFSTSVPRRLRTGDSLLHQKYPNELLDEVLEDLFGDTLMAAALAPTMVTSYDTERRRPLMFKSEKAKSEAGWNLLMRIVARAAVAAPTFFEPVRLETATGEQQTCIDAGLYANNPAMCAYAEARKRVPPEEVFMVSIGTGAPTRPLPYEEVRTWGLAHWGRLFLDLTFDGINHAVDHQLQHLLRPHAYHRLQAYLGDKHLRLDDVAPTNLQAMRDAAAKLIAERDSDLDAICEQLLAGAS
jgi:patatin-like phospholipase/acyl hydrolase